MSRIVSLGCIVAFVFSANAWALIGEGDLLPASFRGGANTTLQAWDFSQEDDFTAPYAVDNEMGAPTLDIAGSVEYLASYDGADGVLMISNELGDDGFGDISIVIPNYPNDNLQKNIWVQIQYQAGDMPLLWAAADDSTDFQLMTPGRQEQLEGDWIHGVWELTLEPNPTSETIVIRPENCTATIDTIVVETQCIPEPASLALLAVGGLLLRKRLA